MDGITEVVYLYLDDIIPNRFQPREIFDEQALKELAVSIKEHGVIQPIIVRKVENKYEIIAGERRYKAATMAGLTKIPALVKNLDDKESSKIALIENLQRKDLTPIEEARTYQKILELEGSMTQQELAATMGKTQSSVSNKLRLLALPDEIQEALLKEKISERHARSLLNVENKNIQIKLLDRIIAERLTVRELDKEIKEIMNEQQVNVSEPRVLFDTNENSSFPVIDPQVSIEPNLTVTPSFTTSSVITDNTITPVVDNQIPQLENLNPTVVDINQIRETAVDINLPQEVKKEVASSDSFKFMPKDMADEIINQDNKIVIPSPNEILKNFFNKEPNQLEEASIKKDVTTTVTTIKTKLKELEQSGYTFNVEESDNPTKYQIIINVSKD